MSLCERCGRRAAEARRPLCSQCDRDERLQLTGNAFQAKSKGPWRDTRDEAERDARLMNAAPELADSLAACLPMMRSAYGYDALPVVAAEAALRKAGRLP